MPKRLFQCDAIFFLWPIAARFSAQFCYFPDSPVSAALVLAFCGEFTG